MRSTGPAQARQAERTLSEARKKRIADEAEKQRVELAAARLRCGKEKADAAAKARLDAEQRDRRGASLARIESALDGVPRAQIDATATAVQAYLASAPDRFKSDVTGAWSKRLAAWEMARLAAARGGVIVRTAPAGAEVTVGAAGHGASPLTVRDMKLGKYPVVIRLAGYEEQRLDAEVKENEFATFDVALARSTGAAQVASNPPGLAFVLSSADKTARGTTPAKIENLPTGDYTLDVAREGWPDQQQTVIVKRNETSAAGMEFVGGRLENRLDTQRRGGISRRETARRDTGAVRLDLPPGTLAARVSPEVAGQVGKGKGRRAREGDGAGVGDAG